MADYPISNVSRRIVYTGSAGVGPYDFPFEILIKTDLNVYKNTTLLVVDVDYTVTISPTLGTGNITLAVAADGADTITIVGNRAIQRTSDFTTGGDLFANTLNDELDSQTIFIQQIAEKVNRAITAPETDPTTINMVLPVKASRASKYLAFDSNGNPVATAGAGTPVPVGTLGTQDANAVAITGGTIEGITDLAIADGGTGASDATGARTNLGLGSMATQNANSVSITGGSISGVSVSATSVSSSTTISATGAVSSAASVLSSGQGGVGYSAGAGGTVTQLTSKATPVTLNAVTGTVVLNAASLASAAIVSFTLTNSSIAATDLLILNHVTTGTRGAYTLNADCATGSASIAIRNNTAGALAEAIVIRFAVIKGVVA